MYFIKSSILFEKAFSPSVVMLLLFEIGFITASMTTYASILIDDDDKLGDRYQGPDIIRHLIVGMSKLTAFIVYDVA